MRVVSLITCDDSAEASIIQGHLQNEGIPCFLTNQNFTNLYPNFNGVMGTGVQIQVNESDFERAAEIIKETHPEVYGNIQEKVSCPNCKSESVKISFGKRKYLKYFYIFLSLLLFYPLEKIKISYICKDCKTEF